MTDEARQTINDLGEVFTEVEADIDPEIYKQLAPHIHKLVLNQGSQGEQERRLALHQRLIKLLVNHPEVGIREDELHRLEQLAQGGVPRNTDWHVMFTVNRREVPVDQPRTVEQRNGITSTRLREVAAHLGVNPESISHLFNIRDGRPSEITVTHALTIARASLPVATPTANNTNTRADLARQVGAWRVDPTRVMFTDNAETF